MEEKINLTVTRHATQRTKDRIGLNKKLSDKNAAKAWKNGLTHGEAKGGLKRFLDKVYLTNGTANNLRVYHHYVYVFVDETLVTILALPTKFCKLADQLQKEKDAASVDVM